MPKNSGNLGFMESFVLSGTAAAISKTSAAPIERVKLLLQNQNELLKQGKLQHRYSGATECITRTFKYEGVLSFWRGNFASVIRYFPQQALNFAFKDQVNIMLFLTICKYFHQIFCSSSRFSKPLKMHRIKKSSVKIY